MKRSHSFAAGLALACSALGAVYVAGADEREYICRPGYAASQRPSKEAWDRLRRAALDRAKIPWELRGNFQVDHIQPLCLGGASTLDNLQAQPWVEARAKDAREAEVCRAYCNGKLTIEAARGIFHRDYP